MLRRKYAKALRGQAALRRLSERRTIEWTSINSSLPDADLVAQASMYSHVRTLYVGPAISVQSEQA